MDAGEGSKPLILVDLDDTLSLTNVAVCQWHNKTYGTELDIEDFHSFFYWKVWGGTQAETQHKVAIFNASAMADNLEPVPGAREALESLKRRGYRMQIITARPPSAKARTQRFLDRHFPHVFEDCIFTNAFQSGVEEKPGEVAKIPQHSGQAAPSSDDKARYTQGKSGIVLKMNAVALIDDSIETALECATNWYGDGLETPSPGIASAASDGMKKLSSWPEEDKPRGPDGTGKKLPVYILFGKWPWNNKPTDRPDPKVPDPPPHPADLDEDFIDCNPPDHLQEPEAQLLTSIENLKVNGKEDGAKAAYKEAILRGQVEEDEHNQDNAIIGDGPRPRRASAAEIAQMLGSGIKAGQITRIALANREKRARKRSLWEGERLPKGVVRVKDWKSITEGPWFPDLRK